MTLGPPPLAGARITLMKIKADVTGSLLTADRYWIPQLSRVTLDPEIGFLGAIERKGLTRTTQIT